MPRKAAKGSKSVEIITEASPNDNSNNADFRSEMSVPFQEVGAKLSSEAVEHRKEVTTRAELGKLLKSEDFKKWGMQRDNKFSTHATMASIALACIIMTSLCLSPFMSSRPKSADMQSNTSVGSSVNYTIAFEELQASKAVVEQKLQAQYLEMRAETAVREALESELSQKRIDHASLEQNRDTFAHTVEKLQHALEANMSSYEKLAKLHASLEESNASLMDQLRQQDLIEGGHEFILSRRSAFVAGSVNAVLLLCALTIAILYQRQAQARLAAMSALDRAHTTELVSKEARIREIEQRLQNEKADWVHKVAKVKEQSDELSQASERIKAEYHGTADKMQTAAKQISEAQIEAQSARQVVSAQFQQITSLQSQLESALKQGREAQAQISSLQSSLVTAQQKESLDAKSLRELMEDQEKDSRLLKEDLVRAQEKLQTLEAQYRGLETELSSARLRATEESNVGKGLQMQIQALEGERRCKAQHLQELEAQLRAAKDIEDSQSMHIRALEEAIQRESAQQESEWEQKVRHLQAKCDDADSTIDSLRQEVTDLKNKMKWEMTSVMDLLKTSQVSWSQKMQRKNTEIRELSREIKRLQASS